MSALWAVALIMLLSGTAKLRSGEDVQATFTRLRVPRPFAAPALARAFPWLELLLAAALLQPFTLLRPVVGLVAVALGAGAWWRRREPGLVAAAAMVVQQWWRQWQWRCRQ